MRTFVLAVLLALNFGAVTTGARAEVTECGFPPRNTPAIPDGKKVTREGLTAAIMAVKTYGELVNAFLDCQEEGKKELFLILSKKQQNRWAEDFNAQAELLTEVEKKLNEQIRIFNARP